MTDKDLSGKSNYNSSYKEVDNMPLIEDVEFDTAEYIKEMRNYVKKLSSMSKDELYEHSMNNLINSGIINEDGKFTEQYRYSDVNYKRNDG